MTDATAVTPTSGKPGYRTSEFWLAALASLLGMLYASGLIHDGSTWARLAGMLAMVLSSLGYSVSRGLAKSG